jgi:molybdopterin molybdotransferase
MIEPGQALQYVVQAASCSPSRAVPLAEACGAVLAEPVLADRNYPPFPRAMMDGYAVRTADAGKAVAVAGEIAAGQHCDGTVAEGQCYEIMTGAACPPGTEAVVEKERVRRSADTAALPNVISEGQHIAALGSECRTGHVVLRPGETITPLGIAVMASFGIKSVQVTPRPTLSIITTGEELVSADQAPLPEQIRDSNGPMLAAMARQMGVERPEHRHAVDKLIAILAALHDASNSDIILLSGGVSVGNYDLVPRALSRYGAECIFHRVRQKPGKPLLFARKENQLIFGLPGNPLAAHLCCHRYVSAVIRRMSGQNPEVTPLLGHLASPVAPKKKRTFFVAAQVDRATQVDQWRIRPVPGVSSADIFAACRANAYVQVPPGPEPVPEGEILPFTWVGNAPWPN